MFKHTDAFWHEQWPKIDPSQVEEWVRDGWQNVTDFKFDKDLPGYSWYASTGPWWIYLNDPPYWFVVRCWIELGFPRNHVFFDVKDGKWFFWDETGSDRTGPYDTECGARTALMNYVAHLNSGDDEVHGC